MDWKEKPFMTIVFYATYQSMHGLPPGETQAVDAEYRHYKDLLQKLEKHESRRK